MRILILTDSLALPRKKPQLTNYSDTWPYLLKKESHEIIQCSIGAATSEVLKKQSNYYNFDCFKPDLVIIQCGIVDCAPRYMRSDEKLIVSRFLFLGKRFISFFNRKWIIKLRGITEIDKKSFISNLIFLNSYFKCPTFFIEIAPAFEEYENILPGVTKNIKNFNQMLRSNVKTIRLDKFKKGYLMSDYHHLNANGHKFIFQKIQNEVYNYNE